jgi:2-polyprenyl-3-methyl-5-hydroxy-6-metoxy-1,4-benzoquinol methylase
MVDRISAGGSVRTAVVWRSVRAALIRYSESVGRAELDLLDAGGGSGGFAVPLAQLGHRVTVVDASPDSLAALERRAAEAHVGERVRGIQGDATNLLDVVAVDTFDAAICHNVLELVDDPGAVLVGIRALVRPGGLVSVVVPNAVATVLHKAVAGRLDDAARVLRDPAGRMTSSATPKRYMRDGIESLLRAAGLDVTLVEGARVFVDVVPSGLIDSDPRAIEALVALELEAANVPALRDIAAQIHVLATRP